MFGVGLNFGSFKFRNNGDLLKDEPYRPEIVVALDGSGDTDDIQEAINLLPLSGGRVKIKAGMYLIDRESITINKSNIELVGEGSGTILKKVDNWDGATYSNLNVIQAVNVGNVRIADLVVDGNKTNQTIDDMNCIYIDGDDALFGQITLQNLRVKNAHVGYGIYITDHTRINIISCEIDSNDGHGLKLTYLVGSKHLISNCNIYDNGESGIYILSDYVEINSCRIYDNIDHGINFGTTCDHCRIIGNSITDNGGSGLYLLGAGGNGAKRNAVATNQILDNAAYGYREVSPDCDYNSITGNIVTGNTTAQISIQGANSIQANNIIS